MGELAGWPYWKVISITGQSGAGTDYQVELEMGDSAGGDFHLEGHCTNFPQDIRITDDDGTTLLDHWVEDITADPIKVYIKVKDDLGSNQNIRVYYGKGGESTVSDGDTTFIFFDDAESGVYSTKWTDVNGTGSYSTLNPYTGSKSIYASAVSNIASNTGSSIDSVFEAFVGANTGDDMLTARNSTSVQNFYGFRPNSGGNAQLYKHNSGWASLDSDPSSDSYSTYALWSIEIIGSTIKTYYNGNLRNNATNSDYPSGSIGAVGSSSGGIHLDLVRIRKANSPEPAFSSAGAEQPPTAKPMWYYDMLRRRNQ